MSNHILYGKHPIIELSSAKRRKIQKLYFARKNKDQDLHELLAKLSKSNISIIERSREDLDELVSGANHQGLVAEVDGFPYTSQEEMLARIAKNERSLCLALDQVQDPQNLGSILRSAYAFGVTEVLILKERACEITAAVAKASAGACEHMNIAKVPNLVQCLKNFQEAGFWSVGLDMNGKDSLPKFKFPEKTVLILGSEGFGMRRLTQKNCDFSLRIPQRSQLNSLNVGTASALVIYEWSQQNLA